MDISDDALRGLFTVKEIVFELLESIKPKLIELNEFIYNNPEPGNEEYKACNAHIEILKEHGFVVNEEYLGLKTAFRAVYDTQKPGPSIAFLAEYDALPGIGHGCGHNLLGATNTGAGIVLSRLMKNLNMAGKVLVFGTPAEETNGAKVEMADKHAFDDIDIVFEAHPADEHCKSGSSLAIEAIEFDFRGKTSHAAVSPEKGINALDAVIQTFVNINSLRQYLLPCSRISGIISEGGKAANIIPDRSVARFYVRSSTKTTLKELVKRVKDCASAASLVTGAELLIRNYETSFDNLKTNERLSNIYTRRLMDLGITNITGPDENYGSLDIGNVSHIVPTIHPFFKITDKSINLHSREFAEATITPLAYASMSNTICALVLASCDIFHDKCLLKEIKKEFADSF